MNDRWVDGSIIHEALDGVQIVCCFSTQPWYTRSMLTCCQPDASKGLGDNKAASANGYLMFNEYIAYDVAQIKLKYLFRVGM